MQNISRKKGFTLIELLVVVAIISLLASVILASLNSAESKARNSQRLSEINEIITGFNLGLNGTNSLPSASGTGGASCISATCYGSWSGIADNPTVDAFLAPGIGQKPADPPDPYRGFGGYVYDSVWGGSPSPYNGQPIPAGSVLGWVMEPPLSSSSCGPGVIIFVTANYVECLYPFQ